MKVSILLATYNSEKYIGPQIDSIINQSYKDWTLIVRDDVSTDRTVDILQEYINIHSDRIVLLNNYGESKGAYLNFVELMKNSDSEYYMFCDHDDIWFPNKIELSMNRMKEVEKEGAPVIVHTDMKVVDQDLNVIHESFWSYSKLLPEHTSFVEMVLCNSANGCTMLFNQRAKEVALPNVEFATMHDMLLNQSVAAVGGIISPIYEQTVLYRQHIDNVVGAQRRDLSFYLNKMKNVKSLVSDNIVVWKMASKIKPISLWAFLWNKIKLLYYKAGCRI